METKILSAYISKKPKNYESYVADFEGFRFTSKSVWDLEKDLPDALKAHIETLQDYEIQPWMHTPSIWKIIYHYDVGSLLDKHEGIHY